MDSAHRRGRAANGLSYSQLMHGLKVSGVELDRKILADLAVKDAAGFAALVASAKVHAPKPAAAAKPDSRSRLKSTNDPAFQVERRQIVVPCRLAQ